jgi:hypothetical protein
MSVFYCDSKIFMSKYSQATHLLEEALSGRDVMIRVTFTTVLLLVSCFIIAFAAQEQTPPASVPTGIVTKNSNLRSAPSLEGTIIGSAPAGTVVTILKEEGNWYRVQTTQGLSAWIYKPLVTSFLPTPELPTAPESPPETTTAAPPASVQAPPLPFSSRQEPLPSAPATTPTEQTAQEQPPEPKPSAPAEPATRLKEEQRPVLLPEPVVSSPPQAPAASSFISYYFSTGHVFGLLFLILLVLLGLLFVQYRTIQELRQFALSIHQTTKGAMLDSKALIPPSSSVSSSAQTAFSPLEKAIVEVLREKGEVPEEALTESLREKGMAPVLIKAAVAELIGKTKGQDTPLIKIRYAAGRYFYSLYPTAPV